MDSMKFIIIVLLFFCASAVAMFRTDGPQDQVPHELTRTNTPILDYNALQGPHKKIKAKNQSRCAADYEAQWRTWVYCAKPFDIMALHMQGYMVFVNPKLMQGTVVPQNLKQLLCLQHGENLEANNLRSQLAGVYKIHLMPFDEDIVPIMTALLRCLARDVKLQHAVSYFKVRAHTDQIMLGDSYLPIVVIYPHAQKNAAQYVLNSLYALFKDTKGQDITPRFNKRITSLLYYAQGDGEFKIDHLAHYYENDRIHYRPDFEGEMKNYYLQNPAENNEINGVN